MYKSRESCAHFAITRLRREPYDGLTAGSDWRAGVTTRSCVFGNCRLPPRCRYCICPRPISGRAKYSFPFWALLYRFFHLSPLPLFTLCPSLPFFTFFSFYLFPLLSRFPFFGSSLLSLSPLLRFPPCFHRPNLGTVSCHFSSIIH